jgi:hypothetical protein
MHNLRNYPLVIFIFSFVVLWASAQAGAFLRKRQKPVDEDDWKDFSTVIAATLTLLGLIVAFSFSMAITRYDQRKNCEAEEANAIGTEYLRLGLLSATDAANARRLLGDYLQQRILFYETRDVGGRRTQIIETATARLETELWSDVRNAIDQQPTVPMALVASGMNDVLNARSYTQAAWWNRIPSAAWTLMITIAIFCNFLIGYGSHRAGVLLFFILPLVLSVAFLLIADIDSPHGGLIRVLPQNMVSLSNSIVAL